MFTEFVNSIERITLFFIALLVFLLTTYCKHVFARRNLPPGPRGFPVIGSMHLMKGRHVHEVFRDLRSQFGDVFSIKLGSKLFVVINGYENLREAFIKQASDFSDRPDSLIFTEILKRKGVIASSGKYWKQTRSWLLKSLRSFGFGKKSMESQIIDELQTFLNIVTNTKGEPYDIKDDLQTTMANIICSITFGQRYDYNDKHFKKLVSLFEENFKLNAETGPANFFPFLKHIPGDNSASKRIVRNMGEIRKYIASIIEKHRQSSSEVMSDVVHTFLNEQEKNGHADIFDDENLIFSIQNLFVAGIETTSSAIRWAILFLMHNREVLLRMRDEIEGVTGNTRLPTLEDRGNMPYCEAVIAEVLRCGNITPLSVTHGAKHDIEFKGFLFPEGCTIVPNLDSIMNDAVLFPDPEKFMPERFLDKEGKLNGTEKVTAFSLGRRVCLGESLARMTLFLFVTAFVTRFDILPVMDGKLPALLPVKGIIRAPALFQFRASSLS